MISADTEGIEPYRFATLRQGLVAVVVCARIYLFSIGFKHHVFYSFAKIRLRPNFHHRIQPFAKGFNPPVILRRAFVGVSRRIGETGR